MATRPETLCYGHFGMREDGMRMLERHRKQLLFWEKRLADEAAGGEWIQRILRTGGLTCFWRKIRC